MNNILILLGYLLLMNILGYVTMWSDKKKPKEENIAFQKKLYLQ